VARGIRGPYPGGGEGSKRGLRRNKGKGPGDQVLSKDSSSSQRTNGCQKKGGGNGQYTETGEKKKKEKKTRPGNRMRGTFWDKGANRPPFIDA